MFYSRFPTYRVVFMQKLPISHVCLSPVYYTRWKLEVTMWKKEVAYVMTRGHLDIVWGFPCTPNGHRTIRNWGVILKNLKTLFMDINLHQGMKTTLAQHMQCVTIDYTSIFCLCELVNCGCVQIHVVHRERKLVKQKDDMSVCDMKGDVYVCDMKGDVPVCHMKGDVPVCHMKGDVSVCHMKGDVPVCDMKGDVSVCDMKGDVPVCHMKGDVPVCHMKGDVPVCHMKGDVPVCHMKGDVPVCHMKGDVSVCHMKGDVPVCHMKGDVPVCHMKHSRDYSQGIPRDYWCHKNRLHMRPHVTMWITSDIVVS